MKKKEEKRIPLYLQDRILKDFENLPAKWQDFDLKRFSKEKTLYDFQEDALKNALKILWKYYEDIVNYQEKEKPEVNLKRKEELFKLYTVDSNFPEKGVDYDLRKKGGKKSARLLEEFYPVKDGKISFENFVNRMGFWMATGSGKTLVIVKLIEILKKLIEKKEIPSNDILFLTHREDLIDQFKEYVKEFNSSNSDIFIDLKDLKNYDDIKRNSPSLFKDKEITVFYYRSDLISDKPKEKIVDFGNYDNDGRWYILLDEAHKGDKEESKRQILYSILSRNGFLFNFSATFTDPRDFLTTVFNFNLKEFIEAGYGKSIYLSQEGIKAFKENKDFSPLEKQKIVLKSLILLTYIRKFAEKIKKVKKELYHYPLLLTLVNTVNPKEMEKEPDLVLFFKEMEKIGQGKVNEKIFNSAKEELIEMFNIEKKMRFPEGEEFNVDKELLGKISFQDVLKNVFNSKSQGNIEVLTIPGNRQEMVFKLRTTEKPFALIKIGNISEWLKTQLEGYEINESFDNESVFKKINRDDSDINILMGSRSFYEGWDSNRPNLILFINIGVGKDAKKFVLQSTGRGVRIEPVENERKRLNHLYIAKKIKESVYNKIKKFVLPIETLFIFGTNANNLKEIVATLKTQESRKKLVNAFIVNPEAKKHKLLIPVYKKVDKLIAEETDIISFRISKSDFELVKNYFSYLGPKIALVKYNCEPKVLDSVIKSFREEEKSKRYDFSENRSIEEPELLTGQILKFLGLKMHKLERFKKLEKEIIHFEEISFFDGEKYEEVKRKIEEVRRYPEKQKELNKLFKQGDQKEYNKQQSLFDQAGSFEIENQKIRIKYLANHYYLPVIISETETIDYLNHIIRVESERKFVEELEEYLAKPNNVFSQFDWWMFSKLDQALDKVGILYYNQKEGKLTDFTPDFIFWLQRKQEYIILFVDPHGTAFRDADLKIDWFEKIFNQKEYSYPYESGEMKIRVKLLFKPARGTIAPISEKYRKYWFDNFDDFAGKIS